jgi:hypothetical protein
MRIFALGFRSPPLTFILQDPDLWSDWRTALRDATFTADDIEWIQSIGESETTIRRLEVVEAQLRDEHGLEESAEPLTLRLVCQAKVVEKKESESALNALFELHDARARKNQILNFVACRFKCRPNIPALPKPRSELIPVCFTDSFDNHTDCTWWLGISQGAPFDGSHTWAIIVGINDYKGDPLERASQDAIAFSHYLKKCGVMDNHVCLLLNNGATRRGIMDALYGLLDDSAVKHGDTFIIYYSGHGTSYAARDYWQDAGGTIEAIVPVDRGGESGVPDISDREIHLFLTDLARERGNNITVILDCCFAAGLTRIDQLAAPRKVSRRTRPSTIGLGPMLEAAESYERKRWVSGLATSHPRCWRPDLSSHVVIAACSDFEGASENSDGGVFTAALIRTLENHNPLELISYSRLLAIMGPVGGQQMPAIAGFHVDCLVFRIPQVIQSVRCVN